MIIISTAISLPDGKSFNTFKSISILVFLPSPFRYTNRIQFSINRVEMFSAKTIAVLLACGGLAAAVPFPTCETSGGTPTATFIATTLPVHSAVVTHRVAVGLGGLHFEPNNIVALPGDVVEFKFLARNHSVAQSSFDEPCKPLVQPPTGTQTGFFAGFDFVIEEPDVLAPNVFQVTVTDTEPIFFYCPQTIGNHCQAGMVGVINQNVTSEDTLASFITKAANTDVSVVPAYIQGGLRGLNPNPDAGFP